MQQKDLESLIRAFSDPSAQKDAAQSAAKLQAFLNSPAGAQLTAQMMQQGSLSQAAAYARSGDMESARRAVQQTLRTPEGARLAAQINAMMNR